MMKCVIDKPNGTRITLKGKAHRIAEVLEILEDERGLEEELFSEGGEYMIYEGSFCGCDGDG